MLAREILQQIEFGNPVAEYDKGLQNYFVITDAFRHLVSGNVDIIAGDKGTGKTAIYQHLKQSYSKIPELMGIDIISGFNVSGEPIFRRLGNEEKLTDGQYVTIWKMYFLSLVGNWFLKKHRSNFSSKAQKLDALLTKIDLLSGDDSAANIFGKLMGWLRNNATPKSVGVEFGLNEYGIPVFTPKVELGKATEKEKVRPEMISHEEAFSILDDALSEKKIVAWVLMDRLDEAFVGRPDIEIPALRALVRTFMDLRSFKNIHLKLFVRNDLFRKITQEGFVNLTHVSARKKEIVWDDNDLYAMMCQRIRKGEEVLRSIGLYRPSDKQLFNTIFPSQINPARGQPSSWKWVLSQVRDGNGVKAPRNVIDLCIIAQEEQLRKERRSSREFVSGVPLIEAESLKKATIRLSKLRIEDTLLAEYGEDVKRAIKAFQNGKSDHTEKSLSELFHIPDRIQMSLIIKALCDIGFLEQKGEQYMIPPIYRSGLNITKGKANGN
ncbi:MAG: hypothetical protein CVU44_12895 [Chloroflexi bacterium HGW-Chloroflexi-6]|nr:MAG: hypothetical protein CVU44_12895 [Chloroflexi bacterium HGW-Chloroflexi-6]